MEKIKGSFAAVPILSWHSFQNTDEKGGEAVKPSLPEDELFSTQRLSTLNHAY